MSKKILVIVTVLFIIIIGVFILLSYLFNNDIKLDQAKFIEEIAKGVVSFSAIILTYYLYILKDEHNKLKSAKANVENAIAFWGESSKDFDRLNYYKGADFEFTTDFDLIKKNNEKKVQIKLIIGSLSQILNDMETRILVHDVLAVNKYTKLIGSLKKFRDSTASYSNNPNYDSLTKLRSCGKKFLLTLK